MEAGGVSYTYDAENTRIATTENGLTTEYVTDTGGSLSRLLVAYEADNTETTYYYGAEGLAAQYNSGTKKYFAYHYDNIGSTTLLTDIAGAAAERIAYGTYGELLTTVKNTVRFLYNGRYGVATDSNGLYYMRARYYNPDIKRFINQDIKAGDIGSSQSLNRYAYCEGNPVSMVDPFGLCGENANDQSPKSKFEKWHNFFGVAGMFWDGFDLINGVLYAAEGDYVNAAISFACGIPAVGNIVAGVAKASKAVKAIKTAEKIAGACRTVGKIGNTAAGMKAMHDTYQTAQREYNTTTEKIAYMAGTLLAGYAMGKTANWGANKLKNLANKALPKLKTAVQEGAERLANQFRKGFGTSGSGHMSRNRGFVILPFGRGGSNPTFKISRTQYPNHVNMLENAQKAGHSLINLKRGSGTRSARKNRYESQKAIRKQQGGPPKGYDYDEFPYASTKQGGEGAYVEIVPSAENQAVGRSLGQFYREYNIQEDDLFNVEIID